jgi:hypothetical protein
MRLDSKSCVQRWKSEETKRRVVYHCPTFTLNGAVQVDDKGSSQSKAAHASQKVVWTYILDCRTRSDDVVLPMIA